MGILQVTRSIPDRCPSCRNTNLRNLAAVVAGRSNTLTCNQCGAMIVIQGDLRDYDLEEEDPVECYAEDPKDEENKEPEVGASFVRCPHCGTVDRIAIQGGEEWCQECSLDPSEENLPLDEIAFLWKKGSQIRHYMKSGLLGRQEGYPEFLTTYCGPHCVEEDSCPQTIRDLIRCHKQCQRHEAERDKEESVGRKSRRKRWIAKRRSKRKKQKATLRCAKSGWYERKIRRYNETPNSQELTHTRGGSGA